MTISTSSASFSTATGSVTSAVSSATPVATTDSAAWDCTIGGLDFLFALSDQYPIRRETSEFRRQRIDSERNPGEQSLDSGYWIRSQSSWHYGAGLKSAEPLEINDAEANFRFTRSGGVNVWTPGKLSLLNSTSLSYTETGNGQLLIGVDGGVLFAQDTDLRYVPNVGSSSAVTWGGSGTINSLTSNGSQYFVANSSGIYKGTLNTGTGSQIYTLSGAGLVRWVKQRLMTAVGASIYEVTNIAPTSPPAALPTALYTHPNSSWTWTDFADGPASIYATGYAGDNSVIFAIGVTSSSTAVTLDVPVVVAELPRGEIVYSLYSYIGSYLVVGTSKGVRVAAIQSDGSLSMGPLVVEIAGGSKDAVAIDRYVYVTGAADVEAGNRVSRAGLYRIDLGQPLPSQEFRFAYATDLVVPSGVSGTATQVTVANGKLYFAVDGAGLYMQGTGYVSSGWLEIGRIRLGTLEPKAWRDLRLLVEKSTYGSVSAYANFVDGSAPAGWSSIVTSDGVDFDKTGSLSNLTAVPRSELFVALKLTSDASGSPVATGYQVRAMPAPRRSRMVQISVMLFDFETDKTGARVGSQGAAWLRLKALEALESSAGTVVYQDHTTGEYSEAYIERISFTRTTPPARANKNAGGVCQILMRLV